MKIKTTLALATTALLAASASPAFAKANIQSGQNACKAAFASQTPAPTSTRLVGDETRVSNDTLVYVYKVKAGAEQISVTCTVDRQTSVATLNPPTTALTASK